MKASILIGGFFCFDACYLFGGVLLCGLTGRVLGSGLDALGFFLGSPEGSLLLRIREFFHIRIFFF
jgi:hypothetical protein